MTAIYGNFHLPFLAPHLHSVAQSHLGALEIVLWHDLPANEIALLQVAFPNVLFEQMSFGIEGDPMQRVARKLHYWTIVCDRFQDNPLCFIDTDTLVLKPIDAFFETEIDVTFTWDNRVRPINSGVLLLRQGRVGNTLFPYWIDLTEKIEANQHQREFARIFSWSAEQHALREMVGFVNYDRTIEINIEGQLVRFKGIEGTYLNETTCKPVSENTHIVHYKGGWQPVLLGKEIGGEWKRQPKCDEMVHLWHATAAQADSAIAHQIVAQATVHTTPSGWWSVFESLCRTLHIEVGLVIVNAALMPTESGGATGLRLEQVTLESSAIELSEHLQHWNSASQRTALLLVTDTLKHAAIAQACTGPTVPALVFIVGSTDMDTVRQQTGCRRVFLAGTSELFDGLEFAAVFPTPTPSAPSAGPKWSTSLPKVRTRQLLKRILTSIADRL